MVKNKFLRKAASQVHIQGNVYENIINKFDPLPILGIGIVSLATLWVLNYLAVLIFPTFSLVNLSFPIKLLIILTAILAPIKLLTDARFQLTGKSIIGVVVLVGFVIFLLAILPSIGLGYSLFSVI
jgi:hypothetical protein